MIVDIISLIQLIDFVNLSYIFSKWLTSSYQASTIKFACTLESSWFPPYRAAQFCPTLEYFSVLRLSSCAPAHWSTHLVDRKNILISEIQRNYVVISYQNKCSQSTGWYLWATSANSSLQTNSIMLAAFGWVPSTPLSSWPLATLDLSSLCLLTIESLRAYNLLKE